MNVKVTLVNLLIAGSFSATPVAFAATKAVDLQDLKLVEENAAPAVVAENAYWERRRYHRRREWHSATKRNDVSYPTPRVDKNS